MKVLKDPDCLPEIYKMLRPLDLRDFNSTYSSLASLLARLRHSTTRTRTQIKFETPPGQKLSLPTRIVLQIRPPQVPLLNRNRNPMPRTLPLILLTIHFRPLRTSFLVLHGLILPRKSILHRSSLPKFLVLMV